MSNPTTEGSPASRSRFRQAADIRDQSRWTRLLQRVQKPRLRDDQLAAQAISPLCDPHVFEPTAEGSGAFGRCPIDRAGLPAYRYELDQYRHRAAAFLNSAGADRRDNWHQLGNDRVTALVSNDGTVQVYLNDRGGVFLNRGEADVKHEGCSNGSVTGIGVQ